MRISNTAACRRHFRPLRGAAVICLAVTVAGCGSRRSSEPTGGVTPGGVSYEARGTGNAVVLIHGFSLDRRMWEPQLEVLVERYRVVQYDLRCHGHSRVWSYQREDRPPDPPAVACMAELSMPVLVVEGERDLPNIHGVVDTLMTCVVNARKLTIPDARHMVNLSAADVFNQAVASFLRGERCRSLERCRESLCKVN